MEADVNSGSTSGDITSNSSAPHSSGSSADELQGKGQSLEKLEGRNVEYEKATNVMYKTSTVTDVGYFTIEDAWMIFNDNGLLKTIPCGSRNVEPIIKHLYCINNGR